MQKEVSSCHYDVALTCSTFPYNLTASTGKTHRLSLAPEFAFSNSLLRWYKERGARYAWQEMTLRGRKDRSTPTLRL
jgi:hypothetical protein